MTDIALAHRAMKRGWSPDAAARLEMAEFTDLRLASKALSMCQGQFPDDRDMAERYALYILGVHEHPQDWEGELNGSDAA